MTCLDWRDGNHWSPRAKPCQHCGDLTRLRNTRGTPTHKTCAESSMDISEGATND